MNTPFVPLAYGAPANASQSPGRVDVAVPETSALELTLRPLRSLLERTDVTELCINRPGEVFVESAGGWECQSLPAADYAWCGRLAKLTAHFVRQRISEDSPLLSASLPGGERIQIVVPPATAAGRIVITIRRPSDRVWTLDELSARGIFERTRTVQAALDETEQQLLELRKARDYENFLRLAVRSRRNILVSGATGSGKTTLTKALIRAIDTEERLVTIEDAQELVLDRHPNHVRLYYAKDAKGLARVSPKQLLECCLRLRPDRILLAELRGEEAFEYVRNVNSGHPGSITSIHAGSAELAFEQLLLLIKQAPAGRELSRNDIKELLYLLVDVVIQCGVDRHRRYIQEVWYDPARKRQAATHV